MLTACIHRFYIGEKMPFAEPIFFDGKYENDFLYPLYVQTISCSFELKKGKIPTIQLKNNFMYKPNEYIKSSCGDIEVLTLTNIDLQLFFEHYDVKDLHYINGWKFRAVKGLFCEYIDYWSNKKIQAKKDKNGAMYRIAKLMLNSLYGKFGLNPNVRGKYPYLDESGVVHYAFYPPEIRKSIFIPIASFVTSYARLKTISTSQRIRDYSIEKYGYDKYVYS